MIGRTNCTQKGGSPSEFVNIQMLTNQAEHSNLNGAVLTMSYETYSKQYTWDGSEITFSVPAHVSCTIEFPEVEGYKKPDNITFVAVEGNSRTIEAEYKAELVKVNVTSSNGSAVSGATLTINGKQQTWNGTEIRQLVPFGTQYSVVAGAVSGFGTPSTQTFTAQNPEREVSVVYIASSLKVNILSNQGTDAAIANVKATVKYGSTSVEVANGGTVNLPSGTSGIITFPDVEGYKKPSDISFTHNGGVTEKTGTYQCELLTVNVSAESGSVSGFEVTISEQETVGVATKYTRLEYIESSGTQYIDTGFKPNQDSRIVVDFHKSPYSSIECLFGVRIANGNDGFAVWATDSIVYPLFADNTYDKYPITINSLQRLSYDLNKNIFKVGGSSVTMDLTNFQSGHNLYLFNLNNNGTINTNYVSGKLYSCQIYDNDILVRDYIPALRSDGIAGLYDAVNDTFTASSGSGNFIAGDKQEGIIATQTSVTSSYKIPFDASYTVKASNVNGYTTPASITRVASAKSYTATVLYKIDPIKDLSKFDIYGNAISQTTANCYVVSKADTYKIPLVFGNALKNGATNSAAYTNNGGSYSHDFVDFNGTKVTSPYIETVSGTAASAQLSIADTDGIFTDISIVDGSPCRYLQFKVNSVPATGANGVLSIKNSSGVIMWSWHIWVWADSLATVEITNSTSVKYKILPVNLASKWNDTAKTKIKNWFYQFGRPNPMLCPSTYNSTNNHASYGSLGFTTASAASHLYKGIQNPTTFFNDDSSYYDWFDTNSGKTYNLWDAACTSTGNSDNNVVKTIYDPCPIGFKMPNGNTFTGFSTSNVVGSFANGYKFKRYSGDTVGVFFPASGARDRSYGSLHSVGSYGFVWLSSAYSLYSAYFLNFYSSSVNPQDFYYRAQGCSVRPVQE